MKITYENETGLNDSEKKLIKEVIKTESESFKKDGNLLPKFFLSNSRREEMNVVAASFSNQEEKELFAKAIRGMIKHLEADGVFSALESWTLPKEVSKEFMANRDKYPTVADHPAAFSVITFSYENHYGNWLGILKCDPKDKTTEDSINFIKPTHSEGLMTNFIDLKSMLKPL